MCPDFSRFYIASSAPEPEGGIYLLESTDANASFAPPRQVATLGHALFLTFLPSRNILLATHDIAKGGDNPTGRICAFRCDRQTGDIRLLNSEATGGDTPCFIETSHDGRFALVANFRGPGDAGSLGVLPVESNGALAPLSDHITFEGGSIHPTRQKCPHIHSALSVPDSPDVYAADLGSDRVHHFRLDSDGHLERQESFKVEPGLGPRHMALHPTQRWLYVITEIGNSILSFSRDLESGKLTQLDAISTLPEDCTLGSSASDLHFSSDARTLIGSNRGHDSLVACRVNPSTGRLSLHRHIPCGGKNPRGFALSGNWCMVANQGSNRVCAFHVDEAGTVAPEVFQDLEIPAPVCVIPATEGGASIA